jgi:hypothetical protein
MPHWWREYGQDSRPSLSVLVRPAAWFALFDDIGIFFRGPDQQEALHLVKSLKTLTRLPQYVEVHQRGPL